MLSNFMKKEVHGVRIMRLWNATGYAGIPREHQHKTWCSNGAVRLLWNATGAHTPSHYTDTSTSDSLGHTSYR